MDKKSVASTKRPNLASKKDGFASPSLQPSSEAFAVPLPPDLEDEGLAMLENIERKPNNEQKELKKQCYGEQDKVRQIPEEGIDLPHCYSCNFVPQNEFSCLFGQSALVRSKQKSTFGIRAKQSFVQLGR